MKYQFNSDSFEAALVALVAQFQKNNPGVSYACVMHDGTKVKIELGKPRKVRAPKVTK